MQPNQLTRVVKRMQQGEQWGASPKKSKFLQFEIRNKQSNIFSPYRRRMRPTVLRYHRKWAGTASASILYSIYIYTMSRPFIELCLGRERVLPLEIRSVSHAN
jgi:hypothetical protein